MSSNSHPHLPDFKVLQKDLEVPISDKDKAEKLLMAQDIIAEVAGALQRCDERYKNKVNHHFFRNLMTLMLTDIIHSSEKCCLGCSIMSSLDVANIMEVRKRFLEKRDSIAEKGVDVDFMVDLFSKLGTSSNLDN